MTHLSEAEKQEFLEDAASLNRREDFACMNSNSLVLAHAEYLEFLTFASTLFQGSEGDRKLPSEKKMLL